MSIGHSTLLSDIRTCKEYRVPTVTLKGIGGKTEPLTRAGILKHVLPNGRMVKWLCYVFDTPVGRSEKLLLLSMSAIKLSGIDVNYHIDQSFEGRCAPLKFKDKLRPTGETHSRAETYYYKIDRGDLTPCDMYRNTTLYDEHDNIVLMTEIQLKNIVDRLGKESVTGTDGDEFTIKDGIKISKFSKEAMEIGPDVNVRLQQKVYDQFTSYVGEDSVFPTKNGSPKILTKFIDHPYSYELLPEYERGEKKMPCTKAMNWEGKTYSSLVIRGFIRGTPVVEKCSNPRCISRLVIVPKLAPGQSKTDPNHGFRVCVNALVNKFLKPCASTIPLAADEITKLFNCKYFLQLDGMNAYWSIPVCEESKRLTAFHTPDGVYCWNRLLMGAKPSSAVQQSAYLEALDQYIDYDHNGQVRQCLLDKDGKRLLDSNGSPKTLRHKFAVYCDDIAAGANTLEELYDLYEALLCCCAKAGIQVKAAKIKFGVREVTFHNYTISEHGMKPKDANLCSIRNLGIPTDVTQVRAFLGCAQQMAGYCKELQIISAPLHKLTKKTTQFPKPWLSGVDYDLAFHRVKALLLDEKLYLHHKDPSKILFIEVDASDVGWGACAYQMRVPFEGDPKDEARMRVGDTGPRNIIQWVSKAWTDHELKLPVFYRETLARLLVLERFRNLIETNISAGAALYTDHKPGLFEESLSNKGQLSAWRIVETADLQSIVEHHYRQGPKMLLADPLSRICAPSSGFYDPSLPSKFQALTKYLPESIKQIKTIRLYANKDTTALSRHVQAWRTPNNPISQGRLSSGDFVDNSTVFFIGVCHAEKSIDEVKELLASDRQFAILLPTGLLPEISRGENSNGMETYDEDFEKQIYSLSKIVLSQEGETWLIRIKDQPRIVEVLLAEQVGCDSEDAESIIEDSLDELISLITILPDWDSHNDDISEEREVHVEEAYSPPTTRSSRRLKKAKIETQSPLKLPHANKSKKRVTKQPIPADDESLEPIEAGPKNSTFNQFEVQPISSWIGNQLKNQAIPQVTLNSVIETHENYPDGLLAIPSTKGGPPRIIVPLAEQENLVKQAHSDIHHQNHRKVHNLLYPLYWWPHMDRDIEKICKACKQCLSGKMRREKIKSEFDALGPQSKSGPRQHYGIDFYGLMKGEILVIVDLFTRETILQWLPSRKQEKVANTILRRVIFERGVPLSIRSDNAPELMKGVMKRICTYLNIKQIVTGGHNPRGNAICERANQTLGNMIRKLTDKEYSTLKTLALPAFQYAMNITPHSSIGCSPFEAGHGLPAQSVAHARLLAQQTLADGARGMDLDADDLLEDVDNTFDTSEVKSVMELAMRMAEIVRSTSEWHRRMSSKNLSQNGKRINYEALIPGAKVYFYKPPSIQEVEKRGRKAKHLDHYMGPATILRAVGSRSFVIQYTDEKGVTRTYQRDASMVSLVSPKEIKNDPSETGDKGSPPHLHQSLTHTPIEEGEYILIKDTKNSKTWYCAQVLEKLPDRIKVSYYTTTTPSLLKYNKSTYEEKLRRMKEVIFLKTWAGPTGESTTMDPALSHKRDKLWTGLVPLQFLNDVLLVRNVGLTALGSLSPETAVLAANLKIAHQVGA